MIKSGGVVAVKTLMACVNHLKSNLEVLAGTPMTQSYQGLEVPIFEDSDSKRARIFSESLQKNHAEGDTPAFDNPYSKNALQAVWNIADILSIALTYTPREWSVGILRGFMSTGVDGKLYLTCLSDSINYIDSTSMLPAPFIIDEVTYRINIALIDFVQEVRSTTNGNALLETLDNLCQRFLHQSMVIDKEIMEIATARTKAYAPYLEDQATHDEQDDFVFYDTYAYENEVSDLEEEFEFYDAQSYASVEDTTEKNNIDWNFFLQCLINITAIAGGAMLVVGLLLPLPGLVIAGACILGVGVVRYFSSHPSSEDEKDGLPSRQPYA